MATSNGKSGGAASSRKKRKRAAPEAKRLPWHAPMFLAGLPSPFELPVPLGLTRRLVAVWKELLELEGPALAFAGVEEEIQTQTAKLRAKRKAPAGTKRGRADAIVWWSSADEAIVCRAGLRAWSQQNGKLARKAVGGDDHALIDLVRRDPRYLGSPLVVAKVLLWNQEARLLALRRAYETAAERKARELQRNRVRGLLEDLAGAVRHGLGSGPQTSYPQRSVRERFEANRRKRERQRNAIGSAYADTARDFGQDGAMNTIRGIVARRGRVDEPVEPRDDEVVVIARQAGFRVRRTRSRK